MLLRSNDHWASFYIVRASVGHDGNIRLDATLGGLRTRQSYFLFLNQDSVVVVKFLDRTNHPHLDCVERVGGVLRGSAQVWTVNL